MNLTAICQSGTAARRGVQVREALRAVPGPVCTAVLEGYAGAGSEHRGPVALMIALMQIMVVSCCR